VEEKMLLTLKRFSFIFFWISPFQLVIPPRCSVILIESDSHLGHPGLEIYSKNIVRAISFMAANVGDGDEIILCVPVPREWVCPLGLSSRSAWLPGLGT
jgi:hypothetical protein